MKFKDDDRVVRVNGGVIVIGSVLAARIRTEGPSAGEIWVWWETSHGLMALNNEKDLHHAQLGQTQVEDRTKTGSGEDDSHIQTSD